MFKAGDKIVFIDDNPKAGRNSHFGIQLEKSNKIYTVLNPNAIVYGGFNFITLEETGECYWQEKSFRKVEEDFAEQVLSKIKEQIEEDQLVLV